MKTTPKKRGEQVKARKLSIKVAREHDGRWVMKCPIGLWEVNGPEKQKVFREGLHYFALYFEGGEYDHLLTPQSFTPTPRASQRRKKKV